MVLIMENLHIKEKIRTFLETIFIFLLFSTQTVLEAGWSISIMLIPLLPYISIIAGNYDPYVLKVEIEAIFFLNSFIVGRIIAFIGLIILGVAGAQWLWYHHKKVGLFTKGLYSKVRHPQFTGIIIITLGLTVIVLTNVDGLVIPWLQKTYYVGSLVLIGLWFLQVLGYIAIAKYEDYRLGKKFGDAYREYKRNVPFLFPIKPRKKIPEALFTLLIVILICFILWILPFEWIGVLCHEYTPNIMI
jgi:protein-S-isoprenylcysteine O-methyltransferase Ste14